MCPDVVLPGRGDLYDADGVGVFSRPLVTPVSNHTSYMLPITAKTAAAIASLRVENPRQWTAETPYLYRLVLTLAGCRRECPGF